MGPLPSGGEGLRVKSQVQLKQHRVLRSHGSPLQVLPTPGGCGAPGQGWGWPGLGALSCGGRATSCWGGGPGRAAARRLRFLLHSGGGSVHVPQRSEATLAAALRCLCGPKWDLGQRVVLTPVVRRRERPLELGPQLRNSPGTQDEFHKAAFAVLGAPPDLPF